MEKTKFVLSSAQSRSTIGDYKQFGYNHYCKIKQIL
jgi:hypothetical protein